MKKYKERVHCYSWSIYLFEMVVQGKKNPNARVTFYFCTCFIFFFFQPSLFSSFLSILLILNSFISDFNIGAVTIRAYISVLTTFFLI